MSLIILPSEADQKRTFFAYQVQRYCKTQIDSVFDPFLAAAISLKPAVQMGCDEICVEIDGHRPKRYSVQWVTDKCRGDKRYQRFLPQPPTRVERLMARLGMKSPGGLYVDPGW